MDTRLAVIAVLAGALAFPTVASARNSHHGGHRSGGVSHAAPRSSGPSRGALYSGNRGAVMRAPRLSTGGVRHVYRAAPQYHVSPRVVQHHYTATRQYRVIPHTVRHHYRATSHRISPGVVQHQTRTRRRTVSRNVAHARLRQHTSRTYTHRRMLVLGAHHRRYRHRRHGYAYYYGGWWYASPWWLESYSDYDYWSDVCASRWGYYTRGYYSCMAYYGFY